MEILDNITNRSPITLENITHHIKPFFSIIIPTCNRIDLLEKCLNSIQNLKATNYYFEVIISDDGENAIKLQSKFPLYNFVRGPKIGPAGNRNNGVKFAKGNWLIFLDDDIVADQNLLIAYIKAINEHPYTLAFEGAILPERDFNADFEECPTNTNGGCFWSANILINTDLFKELNGFDENYRFAALEDQDLYFRILKLKDVIFVKDAKVIHPIRKVNIFLKIKANNRLINNWIYHVKKHQNKFGFENDLEIVLSNLKQTSKKIIFALTNFKINNLVFNIYMLTIGSLLLSLSIFKTKLNLHKNDFVDSLDSNSQILLDDLAKKMELFYNSKDVVNTYWTISESRNVSWNEISHPFHIFFSKLVKSGDSIIDFGCGSAHPYNNLMHKNINYTGLDWSHDQIKQNKIQYPAATFLSCDLTNYHSEEKYDYAISFFVFEHIIYPDKFLKSMISSLKKDGKLVLICPHFINYMNSLKSGFGNGTKKAKLKKFKLFDVAVSWIEEKYIWPKRLKKIHNSNMIFPIYLKPQCLFAPYYSDNDAVHLTNLVKTKRFIEDLGFKTLYQTEDVSSSEEILFLVMEKNGI